MIKLIVFFDNPFWIGGFARFEDGKIEICRVVFRQETKDCEIKSMYTFL